MRATSSKSRASPSSIGRCKIRFLQQRENAGMATVSDLLAQARFHQQTGAWAEAELKIRHALLVDPDHADAHYQLGNLLAHRGDFRAAADCFRQAVFVQPALAEAHNNLGV